MCISTCCLIHSHCNQCKMKLIFATIQLWIISVVCEFQQNNLDNTTRRLNSTCNIRNCSQSSNKLAKGFNGIPLVHPSFSRSYWLSGLRLNDVLLEDLHVIKDSLTLSGFSSGGGIAQQLFIAHSSMFRGVGIFQQTFYRCGRASANVTEFDVLCTNLLGGNGSYSVDLALNDIMAYFHNGLIDNPRNICDKRVYIYAGLRNPIFRLDQMLNAVGIFETFVQNAYNVKTRVQDSTNLFPSDTFGNACWQSAVDNFFVGNCGLNGAFESIRWLIGNTIKLPRDKVNIDLASLLQFDQSEFYEDMQNEFHSMADKGYLYVPKGCGPNGPTKCHLHVYFHGCRSGVDFNDGSHIKNSGWLEVAELNRIVIIFPQVVRSEMNPLGCWDSFGYTGRLYATQKGIQVQIMKKMIDRILGQ